MAAQQAAQAQAELARAQAEVLRQQAVAAHRQLVLQQISVDSDDGLRAAAAELRGTNCGGSASCLDEVAFQLQAIDREVRHRSDRRAPSYSPSSYTASSSSPPHGNHTEAEITKARADVFNNCMTRDTQEICQKRADDVEMLMRSGSL
jgi:hypothetical protein